MKSLRANHAYHWLRVFGLIDGDGRDTNEAAALAMDGVHVLPVPTIENLFLHPAILPEMAAAIAALQGGEDGATRLAGVQAILPALFSQFRQEIVGRRAAWTVNRKLSEMKVSAREVIDGKKTIPELSVAAAVVAQEQFFDALVASAEPLDAAYRLPIKNTGIPAAMVKRLGFTSFKEFRSAVLHQIAVGTPAGERIKNTLESVLPVLQLNT